MVLLFIGLPFVGKLSAQDKEDQKFEYKPLEEFKGDTVEFLNYNFLKSPWSFYEGITVEKLLEYIHIPYSNIFPNTMILGGNEPSGLIGCLVILKDFPEYKPYSGEELGFKFDLEKKTSRIVRDERSYWERRNERFLCIRFSLKTRIPREEEDSNSDDPEKWDKFIRSKVIAGAGLYGYSDLKFQLDKKNRQEAYQRNRAKEEKSRHTNQPNTRESNK